MPRLSFLFISSQCIIVGEKVETAIFCLPQPSWPGCLRDACTILGLDLKDQGDKLFLALEHVGVGKKIKGETRAKHLL